MAISQQVHFMCTNRRLKTVQEQAQSTNKHFNFLNFEQVSTLKNKNHKKFYCLRFQMWPLAL